MVAPALSPGSLVCVLSHGAHGVALRFAFAPEAQGKGFGPEFGRAALGFAFGVARLERVVAVTRPENLASQRALEKFGMVREREIKADNGRTLLLYAVHNPSIAKR